MSKNLTRSEPMLLCGRDVASAATIDVCSPWDGALVARVSRAGASELAAAADEASAAQKACAAMTPALRARVLEDAARLVGERAESIARLIVEEAGKPVALARLEVARARDTLVAAAHVARFPPLEARDLGGFESGAGSLALIKRVPLGPVLAITPFNFPLNLVAHKIAPAIAAGCPIVVKPASQTPSPALALGRALVDAGLPEGALSVLPCRGADASALVDDARFRLVTFTGSSEVGWALKQRAWNRRVTLELGGNAAVIVEADAGDLERIARQVARAAFAYAGQSCIAVQRVLVARAIAGAFVAELVTATRALPTGDPREPGTVCGPLIDAANADRVVAWIERAVGRGARVLAGGGRTENTVAPTLLEHVPHDEPLSCDEVFGPVAVVDVYETFDDALALANASRFGLQAGVFTASVAKARRAWDVLEVGGVIHNDVPTWRSDPMPYGGAKDSGIGREGPAFAYLEMTEERLLVLRP